MKRYLCVSPEPRSRMVGGISSLPYRKFFESLWMESMYDIADAELLI